MADLNGTELLKHLVDLGATHARKILIDLREKSLTPICHIVGRTGESRIIGCIWSSDFEKQLVIAKLRSQAHEMGAKALMMVTEAWFYRPQDALTEDQLNRGDFIPASKHPNRLECVMIVATDGTHNEHAFYEIIRDPQRHNLVVGLKADDEFEGTTVEANILKGIIPASTH